MYQSTRSSYSVTDTAAVLKGISPDGGLFVDAGLAGRPFDAAGCMGLDYMQMAEKIMSHLLPGFAADMKAIVSVYPKKFSSAAITPLTKVGDAWALELYHGPTSAFKDVALSVLPLFTTAARRMEGVSERISILTATSGDTGKAALEGFHDVEGTEITVFFPHGGVSAMQKAQMVTQEGKNVRVCAVRGNFDDCQRGVKEAFAAFNSLSAAGEAAAKGRIFSSANSINIGRLVPQVVYYYAAYAQLLSAGEITWGEKVDFIVPTGNFGDILAGYLAKMTGLPVGRLVCAANSNNVLADFISTGVYDKRRSFIKTVSPSMDILVSSNLERLLFYASGCDCALVSSLMEQLKNEGCYTLTGAAFEQIRSAFSTAWCSEEETVATIGRLWGDCHWLSDTHTAVGFAVLEKYRHSKDYEGHKCVVLSTASPFKFPCTVLSALGLPAEADDFAAAEALSRATGIAEPANLAGLKEKREIHTDVIDASDLVSYALKENW